ncbi:hypothetical protein [uncultured Chryseobacterium sp.]|uniref:hypothetical protein n=1 Tax=uncultured Chryseobacterium sp. TaxID=259322 RepID=UPI00258E55DB|nr:hypothetical protein [uncultured Chryseobacterium sp.]
MLEFLISLFSPNNIVISYKNSYTFRFTIRQQEELDYLFGLEIYNIKNNQDIDIFIDDLQVNEMITFDLTWTSLRKYNFYTTCEDFIRFYSTNKGVEFYILEINSTDKNKTNFFIKNYNDLISIREFITKIADDNFQEKSIIYSENRYLKVLNNFNFEIISKTHFILEDKLFDNFYEDFDKASKEIKVIFKSELINFLSQVSEGEKLEYLFLNFSEFYKRCIIGYEYYLKDFSYNKVKTELDNAVLDFSKNIRTVVNDSQNKLIIIPAAVILAFSTFEIKEPFNTKNIFVFISSDLFAYMMDSFIKNQKSALKIIKTNIDNYKDIFLNKNKSKVSDLDKKILDSFVETDRELKRQENWMLGIRIINWIVPLMLLIYLLSLIYNMHSF